MLTDLLVAQHQLDGGQGFVEVSASARLGEPTGCFSEAFQAGCPGGLRRWPCLNELLPDSPALPLGWRRGSAYTTGTHWLSASRVRSHDYGEPAVHEAVDDGARLRWPAALFPVSSYERPAASRPLVRSERHTGF